MTVNIDPIVRNMPNHASTSPIAEHLARAAKILRDGYCLFHFIWTHPEMQGARLRALTRAVAWQIWQRALRRPWPLRLSPSIELLCYPHSTAAASVLYCRYPDWREMHLVLDILRAGDHFVDVGANVGVYSLMAATIPEVEVWAFEPSTLAAQRAGENIRRNGLGSRCHLYQTAVGHTGAPGYLTVGLGTMNRTTQPAQVHDGDVRQIEAVDIVALDDVIPDSAQTAVAVIKIDVEGDELSVLQGATTLLSRSNAIIIVENNRPDELSAFLTDRGFQQYTYDPVTRRIEPLQLPLPDQQNAIYIRNVAAARLRLIASLGHRT